jgi:paraquat-inducible protein B
MSSMNEATASARPAPEPAPDSGPSKAPRAELHRRGFSIVWLIPLVAGLVAAYLAFDAWRNLGPSITISFATAEGLEAGKTQIRYLDVQVGTVEEVAIGEDLNHIVVTARMVPGAAPHLREGTRFWIVRPRVGVGGVTGLGTLLSGAYIGVEPGSGEAARAFTGLEEPPQISSTVPGRRYILRAETLGSVSRGAPIRYRGLEVGQVLGYDLVDDARAIDVNIFVNAPYDDLVRTNSRFWNASGINVAAGAGGLMLEVGSVQSILVGGIEFDTPPSSVLTEVAPADTHFSLFDSRNAVTQAQFTEKIPFLVFFDGSVRGLNSGAPVEFRGFRLGSVSEVRLEYDPQTRRIRIPVMLELEPQRLQAYGSAVPVEQGHPVMAQLVRQGLRAQLQTGNLLTGDLFVDLVMQPAAASAELDTSGPVPVIPSVPNTLEALQASATQILNKIANLPIEDLAVSLNSTARGLDEIVNSPDLQAALRALAPAIAQLQATVARIDGEAGPLLDSLRASVDAAATTMSSAQRTIGPDSRLAADLESMMEELTRAARSIRLFADYLDRHPEALVRGKAGAGR